MFRRLLILPLLMNTRAVCSLKSLPSFSPIPIQIKQHMELDLSPPICRCNKESPVLDRSVFNKLVRIIAARVPAFKVGKILRADETKRAILNIPRIRTVTSKTKGIDLGEDRLVLLHAQTEDQLEPRARQLLRDEGAALEEYILELNYDYWTSDDILHAILPEELCDEVPSGFAITGHLAHFNLNDEYLPYKHVIGSVILDKNKNIRTVVNKLGNIHSQFRFFDMELIAGEPNYVVEHHESDCRFTFDFSKVYWNSRLHTEHERLVQRFEPSDGVVADVFAGVGPFAIPAAKKGCAVLANDLNPESVKWLSRNANDNHVHDAVRISCEDGRRFIRESISRTILSPFLYYGDSRIIKRHARRAARLGRFAVQQPQDLIKVPISDVDGASRSSESRILNNIAHFVMNLPDSAIEFLDAFHGILAQSNLPRAEVEATYLTMPMVHCYCFTNYLDAGEAEEDVKQRIGNALVYDLNLAADVFVYLVRSVAPNKNMYCVSFRLPKEIAFR